MTTGDRATSEHESTQIDLLAGIAALGTVLAMSYVGYTALADLALGVAAGLLSGAGTFLLLRYIVTANLADDGNPASGPDGDPTTGLDGDRAGGRQVSGGIHGGAAGFALDLGGVAVIASGFVLEEQPLVGVLGALVLVLVGYLVFERTLPRPGR